MTFFFPSHWSQQVFFFFNLLKKKRYQVANRVKWTVGRIVGQRYGRANMAESIIRYACNAWIWRCGVWSDDRKLYQCVHRWIGSIFAALEQMASDLLNGSIWFVMLWFGERKTPWNSNHKNENINEKPRPFYLTFLLSVGKNYTLPPSTITHFSLHPLNFKK